MTSLIRIHENKNDRNRKSQTARTQNKVAESEGSETEYDDPDIVVDIGIVVITRMASLS